MTNKFHTLPFDKSLLIIPAYNEKDNIVSILATLTQLYPDLSILIINDGSTDGTKEVIEDSLTKLKKVYTIQQETNKGLAQTYIEGFHWALARDFSYIFEMDCDFSHNPYDLPLLLEAAQSYDLVIGSRYIGGVRVSNWPIQRLLLSYGASIYSRLITGTQVLDATSGFKCFSRSTLEALNLKKIISKGFSFQIEINYKIHQKGMTIKEVPITFTERKIGKSKMSFTIIVEAVFKIIQLRVQAMLGRL